MPSQSSGFRTSYRQLNLSHASSSSGHAVCHAWESQNEPLLRVCVQARMSMKSRSSAEMYLELSLLFMAVEHPECNFIFMIFINMHAQCHSTKGHAVLPSLLICSIISAVYSFTTAWSPASCAKIKKTIYVQKESMLHMHASKDKHKWYYSSWSAEQHPQTHKQQARPVCLLLKNLMKPATWHHFGLVATLF